MFTPEMMESVKKVEAQRTRKMPFLKSFIRITGKRHLQRSK